MGTLVPLRCADSGSNPHGFYNGGVCRRPVVKLGVVFVDALAIAVVDGVHYRAQVVAGDLNQHKRVHKCKRLIKIVVVDDVKQRAVGGIVRWLRGAANM
jgi:hypothetical protein